jgi:hypothetical protein
MARSVLRESKGLPGFLRLWDTAHPLEEAVRLDGVEAWRQALHLEKETANTAAP